MKLQELSPKQRDFLVNSDARINIACGAVRSGKTIVSLLKWLYIVATAPEGAGLLMIAKTERTLRRNILDIVMELVEPSDFRLNSGIGECWIYGKRIYLVGANDERAENKIRGITLYAAYLDEATLCPESFFQMLLSRLSEPNSILIATTNPDSPAHYIKKGWIDRAEDARLKYWHFTLDDNTTLDPAFVDAIKTQYVGLWRKRFVDGLWAIAEGAVYDMWDESKHVARVLPLRFSDMVTGIDYGTSNPTSFIALGMCADGEHKGKWMAFKEYYFDGRKGRQKTDKELSDDLKTFLKRDAGGMWAPSAIEVDPSAASFKVQLRRDGISSVHDADNSLLDGIRNIASLLTMGQLVIHESCANLIKEFPGYSWDIKSQAQGKDVPIGIDNHALDALRYATRRAIRRRFA